MPKRNNVGSIDCAGLLAETRVFGVLNNRQFRKLMLKHRPALLQADREPLTRKMGRLYRDEYGDAVVDGRLRRQYWFSWEALTRLALEFEFGAKYRSFAEHRDNPKSGSSDSRALPPKPK